MVKYNNLTDDISSMLNKLDDGGKHILNNCGVECVLNSFVMIHDRIDKINKNYSDIKKDKKLFSEMLNTINVIKEKAIDVVCLEEDRDLDDIVDPYLIQLLMNLDYVKLRLELL